jgi:endonuclease/exonuclease/phosphatase (EEP) superfamily protein YafD
MPKTQSSATPQRWRIRSALLMFVVLALLAPLEPASAVPLCSGPNPPPECFEPDPDPPGHNPIGNLERVERRPGGIWVQGWAIDPDITGPIRVAITIGRTVAIVVASSDRPDVAADYPGFGNAHGFDAVVPVRPGSSVCAVGVNVGAGRDSELACVSFAVRFNPFGSVDDVWLADGSVGLEGWAIDPDTTAPVAIRVAVDGSFAGGTTADLARSDVGTAYPGYGDAHGFRIILPAPRKTAYEVCVTAVNAGGGTDGLVGCQPVRQMIELGSAGLPKDLKVSSEAPQVSASRRARRNSQVLLVAVGEDPDTGVKNVRISGSVSVVCVGVGGLPVPEVRVPVPIAAENPVADSTAPSGPGRRAVAHVLDVAKLRTELRCSRGYTFQSLRVEVTATVDSFDGTTTSSPQAVIHHEGPDYLKVATFNIRQSAVRAEPDGGVASLQRWGRNLLSKADVVLLDEVWDAEQVRIMAESSGLVHRYVVGSPYVDVAIISRYPMRWTQQHEIPPGLPFRMLDARIDIEGVPHRFLATHWENDPNPWTSHPDRVAASQITRQLLVNEADAAFFGGDLNAYSYLPEVRSLDAVLRDAFFEVPGATYCGGRVDYVFARGPYTAVRFESDCSPEGWPSDHPFVLVTYERT